MSWLKTGDEWTSDRRWMTFRRGQERLAYQGLWAAVGTWSAGDLGDGLVPLSVPKDLQATKRMIERMFDVGWWHDAETLCGDCAAHSGTATPDRDHFVICHWWLHIEDRATVLRRRKLDAERKKLDRHAKMDAQEKSLRDRMSGKDARADSPEDADTDSPEDSLPASSVPARPGPTRPLSVVTSRSNGGVRNTRDLDAPPQCEPCQRNNPDGARACGRCRNMRLRWESDQALRRTEEAAAAEERKRVERSTVAESIRTAQEFETWRTDPAVIAACSLGCDETGRHTRNVRGVDRKTKCSHGRATG